MKALYTGRTARFKDFSDEKLAAMAVMGDNIAFDCITLKYTDYIFHFILKRVHLRHMSQDIFQDTFMSAFIAMRKGNYHEKNNLQHWLSGCAFNRLLIYWKDRDKKPLFVSVDDIDIEETNPSDHILAIRIRLGKALHRLSRKYRLAVILHFFKGMSFRMIGLKLGISTSTADSNCHRGIENLRKILQTPY